MLFLMEPDTLTLILHEFQNMTFYLLETYAGVASVGISCPECGHGLSMLYFSNNV